MRGVFARSDRTEVEYHFEREREREREKERLLWGLMKDWLRWGEKGGLAR